jgi:serine/threonine protein kinase/Flp pilus assembly protein TadD
VSTEDAVVSSVATSILDGIPIDWPTTIESSADASRPVLAQLQVLAAIADVHRSPNEWGHLRLLERIGHGAFGDVYRAWDTRLDREVALKLLPAADAATGTSTIIREGRLLARVRHPNVVTIYGAEQIDDVVGLWMEFVRGQTLKRIVDSGRRFTESEVIEIGRSLCAALAAVHRAGLLHRDVKAHNVMLADDGRVVLMDFGTGRDLGDNSGTDLAGTPLYLASEIFEGGSASIRSDIYSLGVLLFHLLTGSYPVRADSIRGVRRAHANNRRSSVLAAREDAARSPKLARIIERAIQPCPKDRYASASALEDDLKELAANTPAATRNGATIRGVVAVLSLATATVALIAIAALGALHSAAISSPPHPTRSLLAVLPFENLPGDGSQEYFSDGLTEELINQLGNADPQHLGVIARASVMRYKGDSQKRDRIQQELGVQYVLEGRVRRGARRVRITAELIRTNDRTRIWAREYDRELSGLPPLQAEIAQDVARQTRLSVADASHIGASTQARPPTRVYEAYDQYLRGRYFWNRRTREGFFDAVDAFEKAIALDPAYARAYAGLADSYALMASYSLGNQFIPKARVAALRALELDDQLAEAHTSLALIVENHDWDWAKAEHEYLRAIELDPNYATAHHWYGEFLGFQGRFDEALAEFDRARQLDPLSLIIACDRGALLYFARQYDRSIEQYREVLGVEPGFPRAHTIVNPYAENGMFVEALAEIEKYRQYEDTPWTWAGEAYVYRRWGRLPEARRALSHLEDAINRLRLDPTPYLASAYIGIDNDKAIAYMEKAYAEHSNALVTMKVSPGADPIRGDPRFQDLLRRMRLAPAAGPRSR